MSRGSHQLAAGRLLCRGSTTRLGEHPLDEARPLHPLSHLDLVRHVLQMEGTLAQPARRSRIVKHLRAVVEGLRPHEGEHALPHPLAYPGGISRCPICLVADLARQAVERRARQSWVESSIRLACLGKAQRVDVGRLHGQAMPLYVAGHEPMLDGLVGTLVAQTLVPHAPSSSLGRAAHVRAAPDADGLRAHGLGHHGTGALRQRPLERTAEQQVKPSTQPARHLLQQPVPVRRPPHACPSLRSFAAGVCQG